MAPHYRQRRAVRSGLLFHLDVELLILAVRALVLAAAALIVLATVASSIRTVILPRGVPSRLTRWVFQFMRRVYNLRIGRGATYERRDRIMASYGPVSLLALLLTWIVIVLGAFQAIYWALGHDGLRAFQLSGSAVVTLGFAAPDDVPTTVAVICEAVIGLVLLALLITYLPTLYGAFQRRESLVTKLEVRAGSPPSGIEMLERLHRLSGLQGLSEETWRQWEDWFVDIGESHTSLPALNFFRSPEPQRSWITAAGAVLDGASLYISTLEVEGGHDRHADLCIRAGYLALRQICAFFRLAYAIEPQRVDPISIAYEEYLAAYDRMRDAGLPVKPDRDQAWRDFAGWRVNYDDPLLALAQLVSAPYAPWSSDRGALRRPSLLRGLIAR
jgi:hypothetical protein